MPQNIASFVWAAQDFNHVLITYSSVADRVLKDFAIFEPLLSNQSLRLLLYQAPLFVSGQTGK